MADGQFPADAPPGHDSRPGRRAFEDGSMVLQNILQRRLLYGTASFRTHSPRFGRSRISWSRQGRRCLDRRQRDDGRIFPFKTTTGQTPQRVRIGSCTNGFPIKPAGEDHDPAHGRRSSRQILRPQRTQGPHLLLAHGRGKEATKAHPERPGQNRS